MAGEESGEKRSKKRKASRGSDGEPPSRVQLSRERINVDPIDEVERRREKDKCIDVDGKGGQSERRAKKKAERAAAEPSPEPEAALDEVGSEPQEKKKKRKHTEDAEVRELAPPASKKARGRKLKEDAPSPAPEASDDAHASAGEDAEGSSSAARMQRAEERKPSPGRGEGDRRPVRDGGDVRPGKGHGRGKFVFGNYDRYYGYRTGHEGDARMQFLKRRWFRGKRCLDVGCNSGALTIAIAREFEPAHIVGVDIDAKLIANARRHVRQQFWGRGPASQGPAPSSKPAESARMSPAAEAPAAAPPGPKATTLSMVPRAAQLRGAKEGPTTHMMRTQQTKEQEPIEEEAEAARMARRRRGDPEEAPEEDEAAPERQGPAHTREDLGWPYNVSFRVENYVEMERPEVPPPAPGPEEEAPPKRRKERAEGAAPPPPPGPAADHGDHSEDGAYDVILCMSVTKWVHLNWGDDGLLFLFRKMHRSLKPGGVLILEPQPWRSYQKKHRISPVTRYHFEHAKLRPDTFPAVLARDIGFSSVELIGVPEDERENFRRPIYKCTK
eukprot:tig00001003_g6281.t1